LITVNADASKTRLQVLVPGVAGVEGSTTTGISGTPASPVAGTGFNATVRAVDDYFNLVTANNPNITFGLINDTHSVVPGGVGLNNGAIVQPFTLMTAATVQ